MRYSLFFDPLFDPRVFGEPSGGGGGGGGSSSSDDDDKPAQKPTLTKADNTIGQVSKTGQYAGDGFEWVETTTSGGTQFLTRTYTGAGKDNGLGQDVRFGNTAQKDEKEAIAQISLNEGSAFAASPASATDIPANEIGIPTGFFPESDSYAEQVGQTDYEPTVKYIQPVTGGLGVNFDADAVAKTIAAEPAVDTTPDTSPRPKPRPEPEPEPVETGPAFDYTGVSVGELGRGAPEDTLPPGTVEYKGGVDPELEVLSALKNSSSDPVGEGLMNTGEYLMAQDYENQKADSPAMAGTQFASAGNLSGLATDFSPLTIPLMDETVTKLDPMSAQEASFDQPSSGVGLTDDDMGLPSGPVDFSQFEPDNKSLLNIGTTDLLPGLAAQGGEQVVSGILETARDLNVPGSGAEFVQDPMYKYRAAGLGDMSGLDRMTDEQYLYRTGDLASQETGSAAMRLPNATTVVENVLQNIADKEFAEMRENIEKLSPETRELVQSPAVTIPNKFGYGLDQVDPAFARPLGEDPNKLNLSGIKVDPMAAGAQTILTSPAFLATLGTSFVNPYAGATLGGTLAGGEGQRSINAEIDEALESGVLQNTPQYQEYLTALNASENTAGLSQADKDARIVGQLQNDASRGLIPLNFLAAGVSAITPGLLKSGRSGAVASPFIEGVEEGPFETALTNRALLGATDIEKKVDPSELASESLVGGLTATGPSVVSLVSPRKKVSTKDDTTDTKAFVPTSATAGQIATDPAGIQTEYEKASGVDTTQMRPEIAPDRVTVAEMLIEKQLEDEGYIKDLTELNDLNVTEQEIKLAQERAKTNLMDKDAKMLRALVEDSVVNTGGISAELVEEMNAKLDSAVVARITQEAFNNPLVTKDGETRVDLGIQKAAIEDALRRPPSGIEQAMLPTVDAQTSIPTVDRTAPKDNTAKEDSAVARAQEDQAVFDAANEALAESRREASLDQPTGDMVDQAIAAGVDSIQDLRNLRAENDASVTFADAIKLVNETGKVSPSYLQRQLQITYTKANELVNEMQDQGLVSEANYVGKRTVNTDAVAEAARETSLEQPASQPTPEVAEEVSGIEQVAETKDTTPKPSPFTEEGRKGITALNTSPSKVNLSQTEEEVVVDTKPPAQTQTETEQTSSAQTTVETEPTDGSTTVEIDKTASKVASSIDPPESPDDEDEAVEVEVDDTPEAGAETETGATVELNLDLPFVAPDIVKDENGNDTFKCPDDSYTLVQGPDGPTCKKNERASRMRAGRSLSPYTRLNIPEGYKGPGQKRESPRA